jgi:hypothetical protein
MVIAPKSSAEDATSGAHWQKAAKALVKLPRKPGLDLFCSKSILVDYTSHNNATYL